LCSKPDNFTSKASKALHQDDHLELYISDATILEIALKSSLGKLELPAAPRVWIEEQCDIWGITTLPLSHEEIYVSTELPWHHKDPFDRLIVATSMTHHLPVITSDRFFCDYGIEVIW
jgi:PIN domain nuclease of toxin-antitoxin system